MSSLPTGTPKPPPRSTAFEVGALLDTAVKLVETLKWRGLYVLISVDPQNGIILQIPSSAGDDRASWIRFASEALEGDPHAATWVGHFTSDKGCYRLTTTWAEVPVQILTLIPRQDAARLGVPYRPGPEGTMIGGSRS